MSSNYGDRWTKAYGTEPSQAWRELLGRYSPNYIAAMLNDLPNHAHLRQYPPTLPQVESLLQAASRVARAALTEADWRRGYWRSLVVSSVIDAVNRHGDSVVRQWHAENFEPVLVANKGTLGRSMADLLSELDSLEVNTGQRTEGMHAHCKTRAKAIAGAFYGLFHDEQPQVHRSDDRPPEGAEGGGIAPF